MHFIITSQIAFVLKQVLSRYYLEQGLSDGNLGQNLNTYLQNSPMYHQLNKLLLTKIFAKL